MDFQAWWALVEQWPTDWIIIVAVAIFIALDARRSGTARAAPLMVSLPAVLLITNTLPDAIFLGVLSVQITAPLAEAAIFVGIAILLYFVAHRAIFSFSEGGGVVQALIAGFAASVILVIVWLQVPALESVWSFGDQVRMIFGEAYRFWWLIAAFAGLTFARS